MSSDDPLLSKMDALLRKHRGEGETYATEAKPPAAPSAPPPGWLPVLTQVIERGTLPESPPSAPADLPAGTPAEPAVAAVPETPAVSGEALADQLMRELAPRLSEVMEKQVAAELRKNLDQTVASLLSQLDVNMREIVRDAVAEKLKQPRDPS